MTQKDYEYVPVTLPITIPELDIRLPTQGAPVASKDDSAKPDLSLLPRVFKEVVAKVMMFGAKKYGRWNYTKGHDIEQLIAAAERHLDALKDGEDLADDSKLSHWGHIAANCLMALHQLQLGTLRDSRFKKKE